MLPLANPQTLLVNGFMRIAGFNDTNHPAVKLVEYYLIQNPEIIKYTKWAALWVFLNILTATFITYVAIRLFANLVRSTLTDLVAIFHFVKSWLMTIVRERQGVVDIHAAEVEQSTERAEHTSGAEKPVLVEVVHAEDSIIPGLSKSAIDEYETLAARTSSRAQATRLTPKRTKIYEWEATDSEEERPKSRTEKPSYDMVEWTSDGSENWDD